MYDILSSLLGVYCHVDDILVFENTTTQHDSRLNAVLERNKTVGITLNAEKCHFSWPHIGNVIDYNGVSPDAVKTAILANETTIFNNRTQEVHGNGQPND